jgi:APA family basic amino acid/polyamine antiporter
MAGCMARVFKWYDVALWGIANSVASGLLIYSVQDIGRQGVYGADVAVSYVLGGVAFLPIVLSMIQVGMYVREVGGPYVLISKTISPYMAFISIAFYMFASGTLLTIGFLTSLSVEFLSTPIYLAGHYTGNGFLTGLGLVLNSTTSMMVFSVLMVALIWMINSGGYGAVRKSLYLTTLLPLTVLTSLYTFTMISPKTVSLLENKLVDFHGIVKTVFSAEEAAQHGLLPLAPADAESATLNYALVVFWSYLGLEMPALLSGEVKEPEKSFVIGGFTAYHTVLLAYLLSSTVVKAAGSDLLAAYSYLYMNNPGLLQKFVNLEILPQPSLFLPFYLTIHNSLLLVILGFAGFLFFFNTALTSWASSLRAIHALSRDGFIPTYLGEFNRDTGVYPGANNIIFAGSLVGVALGLVSREFKIVRLVSFRIFNLSYGIMIMFLGLSLAIYGITSLAGTARKYRRRKTTLSVVTGLLCFLTGLMITVNTGVGASFYDFVGIMLAGLLVTMLLLISISYTLRR